MYIMFWDRKTVLHVIVECTMLNYTHVFCIKIPKSIWNTFMRSLCKIYVGPPNQIFVDQGTEFGGLFAQIAEKRPYNVEKNGTKDRSSLDPCERYHQHVKTVYQKVRSSSPSTPNELAVSISVKSVDDVSTPNRLKQSLHAFGTHPALQRLNLVLDGEIMAKLRAEGSLKHAITPATKDVLNVGEPALVWREKEINNRIVEWIGPFNVSRIYLKR